VSDEDNTASKEVTALQNYHKRLAQEYAELDNPIVRGQLALDRAWQARLDARFNRPDAISEYDPIKRLDRELDAAQAEADNVRRHFTR
jgi:hypothetical protein